LFDYGDELPEEPSPKHRHDGHILAANVRVRSNEEVVTGFTHQEALDESCRCLRCDIKVANVS
jgi:hypothetical protein